MSAELTEPLTATAPVARGWLALEQPGPWGRAALTESHLDHHLATELEARLAGTGVRMLLIRRPGPHPDHHVARPRQVYLAHTAPGATWLEQARLTEPKDLLDLDPAALTRARPPGFGRPCAVHPVLVCTNARRDRCCALLGLPLVAELAGRHGARVWECSHLGGHRFAPTLLVLPAGHAYGRVDGALGEELLAAADAGRVVRTGYRGRSTWSRAGQAAEIAIRERIGETASDALTVLGETPLGADRPDLWSVLVAHADGRRWNVTVTRTVAAVPRPESCGKDPARPDAYSSQAINIT